MSDPEVMVHETKTKVVVRTSGNGGNYTFTVNKTSGEIIDMSGAKVTDSDIAVIKLYLDAPTKDRVNGWRKSR